MEDKYIIDAVEAAIEAGWTPTDFIREAATHWELELKERAKNAMDEFNYFLNRDGDFRPHSGRLTPISPQRCTQMVQGIRCSSPCEENSDVCKIHGRTRA